MARYLVEAVCGDYSSATTLLRRASHWLSLTKLVQSPSERKCDVQSEIIEIIGEATESRTTGTGGPIHDLPSEVWEFSEESSESWNVPHRLDLWVIPIAQSSVEYPISNPETIILSFDYFQPEFIDIAWLRAMKKLASRLGQSSYTPDELLGWYLKALLTWEDNVDRHPNNLSMVSKLAEAYAELGDLKVEIAGWCRLFERHPTNLSFLELLHRACKSSSSLSAAPSSLLSFPCLCMLHLIERNGEQNGLNYLEASGIRNASTSDSDPQLLQLRLIDSGAYGDVYVVYLSLNALTVKMFNKTTNEVFYLLHG